MDRELSLFLRLLEALTETGELRKSVGGYSVTGKAFETVESFETDERRHTDIRGLTILLLLIAILEVVFATFF
jgi:hypothetical protein